MLIRIREFCGLISRSLDFGISICRRRELPLQDIQTYLSQQLAMRLFRRRVGTARSKGKVERPFRTVKEMHETLYHFHEPQDEQEAKARPIKFLVRYNAMEHRSEPHSRMEDWLENLPASGVRAVCSWERFCTFAREPERRRVGNDARLSVAGVNYEVDPDLAGFGLHGVALWPAVVLHAVMAVWCVSACGAVPM